MRSPCDNVLERGSNLEVWLGILLAGALLCALQAILATRLLASAIWLAGTSALVAIVLYQLGAPQVAVIELSVGAGLVTVLFVFAISIAGEDAMDVRAIVPRPVGLGLVIVAVLLLSWMTLPALGVTPPLAGSPFAQMLWEQRGLDVLVQIVLIFAGAVGMLGLLGEEATVRSGTPAARPTVEASDPVKEIKP
jgi:uncharacterized MnhB-related membrane protein